MPIRPPVRPSVYGSRRGCSREARIRSPDVSTIRLHGRGIKQEMRDLLAERGLSDLGFAVVASYSADPSLNGLSMKQVAQKTRSSDSLDDQLESARAMMLKGGASMVYHLMSDADVERIMRHPQVGIASDSSVLLFGDGMPHPRGYGNNARVLGEYVRTRHVIPDPGSRPKDDLASRAAFQI